MEIGNLIYDSLRNTGRKKWNFTFRYIARRGQRKREIAVTYIIKAKQLHHQKHMMQAYLV